MVSEKGTAMRIVQSVIAVIVIGLTLIGFQEITRAQAPQPAPNHVHYSEPAQQSQPSPTGALAPRLQNLGKHRFPVTTKNAQAQLFMNQGLNLSYAFNHAEAGRAYREAERLDPNLAIAYWGEALALGPNINAPMDPASEPKALEVIQKAVALKTKALPREQALIDALTQRYSGHAEDRKARDVGYADAVRSNEMAIAADEDYISQCRAQGLYPMAYYPHNLHFLWFASTAEGKSKLAIEASRKAASQVNDETLKAVPLLAGFRVVPYYALTRFGKWDEMLREPEPPAVSAYLTGMWRYARATAFLGKGQTDSAEQEAAKLKNLMADKSLDQPLFSPNTGRAVLSIAQEVLAGNT